MVIVTRKFVQDVIHSIKLYGTHRLSKEGVYESNGIYCFSMDNKYIIEFKGHDVVVKNTETNKEERIHFINKPIELCDNILSILTLLSKRATEDTNDTKGDVFNESTK